MRQGLLRSMEQLLQPVSQLRVSLPTRHQDQDAGNAKVDLALSSVLFPRPAGCLGRDGDRARTRSGRGAARRSDWDGRILVMENWRRSCHSPIGHRRELEMPRVTLTLALGGNSGQWVACPIVLHMLPLSTSLHLSSLVVIQNQNPLQFSQSQGQAPTCYPCGLVGRAIHPHCRGQMIRV